MPTKELRKQYERLSNTLSSSGQSELDWIKVAQEFGDAANRGEDFSFGSNLSYGTKLRRGGPKRYPWLLIGGQD